MNGPRKKVVIIAGPNGEADWIIMDPEIDFKALYNQFDTMLMGRRTFEVVKGAGGGGSTPGMQVLVFSRTLRQQDHPGVTIVDDPEGLMAEVRSNPGKDVWLFGGGSLFRSFAELCVTRQIITAIKTATRYKHHALNNYVSFSNTPTFFACGRYFWM